MALEWLRFAKACEQFLLCERHPLRRSRGISIVRLASFRRGSDLISMKRVGTRRNLAGQRSLIWP